MAGSGDRHWHDWFHNKKLKACKSRELSEAEKDRLMGCLYGQAIGDALGGRYEFKSSIQAGVQVGRDTDSNGHLPILGGGHLKLIPGQVTDDTELAMALARSLVRKGTYVSDDVCASYVRWYKSGCIGLGRTTMQALDPASQRRGSSAMLKTAVRSSRANNMESLSNGCLMRICPLAMAGFFWEEEVLLDAARSNCQITNPNAIAQDGVASFVGAIRSALLGQSREEVYQHACDLAATTQIKNHLSVASGPSPEPCLLPDGTYVKTYEADRFPTMGYFGIAIQHAFYALLNCTEDNFEKCMVDIVKLGGDSDTNGCIAGALIGAVVGAKNIPKDWKECVVNARPTERLEKHPECSLEDLEDLAVKLVDCTPPSAKDISIPN